MHHEVLMHVLYRGQQLPNQSLDLCVAEMKFTILQNRLQLMVTILHYHENFLEGRAKYDFLYMDQVLMPQIY